MGGGVHSARAADCRRQAQGQKGVVYDAAGQDALVAAGGLHPVLGAAPDRRHLGARIGRGQGDDGDARIPRDGLGEADRGAAARRHGAVRVEAPGFRDARLRHLGGDVHPRFGINADGSGTEPGGDLIRHGAPARRGQHQGAGGAQALHLLRHPLDRADAEDDAHGGGLENEVPHRRSPGQRPLKTGLRFSAKAATPSLKSSERMVFS